MNNVDMEIVLKDCDVEDTEHKNFPELCNFLGIEVIKSGASKVKFLEMLEENFDVVRKGHKFIIGKRRVVAKRDFGLDKDSEVYKATGRLFYSYMDTMGINKVHYITNSEFALHFTLINELHKTFMSAVPRDDKSFVECMNRLIDTDYTVLINELIRDKIGSFAKRDIYNSIQEVWMCKGEEVNNQDLLQLLNDRKDWIIDKYGVLVDNETRQTIKEQPPVAWGKQTREIIYGYRPKDATKKAMIALNEQRDKDGKGLYYKAWKIAYVMNPYEITIRNEKDIINEKRMELVNNRMYWDGYTGKWKEIYDFVRKVWIDWMEDKIKVEPVGDVLRIVGINELEYGDMIEKLKM